MDVVRSVDAGQIDPICYRQSYVPDPGEDGGRGHRILSGALEGRGVVGLARVALREREYPATEVAEEEVVAAEAPPVAGLIDLMEALRASEEVTKKRAAAG